MSLCPGRQIVDHLFFQFSVQPFKILGVGKASLYYITTFSWIATLVLVTMCNQVTDEYHLYYYLELSFGGQSTSFEKTA